MAHLSGKFEWGDYQKAIFLSNCIEKYEKTSEDVGKEIGLGRNNAKAIYQAYKVYQVIQNSKWYKVNEDEGCRDEDHFPFFYEAMKKRERKKRYFKVSGNNIACAPENVEKFCESIGMKEDKELESGQSIEEAMRLIQIEKINHKKIILSFLNYLQKIPQKEYVNYFNQLSKVDIKRLDKIKEKLDEMLQTLR